MDQEVVEGYNTQQQVTIRSFAFESTPNTAIVAEIPPGFEADFDGDGDVDGDDFLAWQTGFGTPSGAMKSQGDYDNDGDVDGDDFLGWQDEFGSPAAGNGSGAVPEPSSLALLAAGAGALAFRRRTNSV